jgi:hypothetical protein
LLIIYNQGFQLKKLDPEVEMEKLYNPELFKMNPGLIINIMQTCLQSPNLGMEVPIFEKLESLVKQCWYQMNREHQFVLMNLYNYFQIDSKNLENEFNELNEQIFLSQK